METELVLLEVLIGQIMPYAVDFINRYIKSSNWRYIVSVVSCLLIGVGVNFDQLAFSTQNLLNILQSVGVVFLSAQSAYALYYEHSPMQHKLRFTRDRVYDFLVKSPSLPTDSTIQ